jgi:hypothetical protein
VTWTWWEKDAGSPNEWPELPLERLEGLLHSGARFARKFPKGADRHAGVAAKHRGAIRRTPSPLAKLCYVRSAGPRGSATLQVACWVRVATPGNIVASAMIRHARLTMESRGAIRRTPSQLAKLCYVRSAGPRSSATLQVACWVRVATPGNIVASAMIRHARLTAESRDAIRRTPSQLEKLCYVRSAAHSPHTPIDDWRIDDG